MDDIYSLGLLLNMASSALASGLTRAFKNEGIALPHSQFVLLRALYFRDGMSQHEAAKLLSKDAAAIKRTVDYLEEKGLTERHQVRTLKNELRITDEGKTVIREAIKVADRVIDQAFGELVPKDREKLLTNLETIYKNANNID